MIDRIILPKLDVLEKELSNVEFMSREGSPYVKDQIRTIKKDIVDIKEALLTPDSVSRLISDSLQKTEARGWTHRERWMGVVLFLVAVGTFILSALSLKLGG